MNLCKQTKIQKGTNHPYFNEIFFFNFRQSESELCDEVIYFELCNSRTFRSDMKIGTFKIDLAYIYSQVKHSINRKWLLLSNEDDRMSGAKGYLKVSINILGPGDEPSVSWTLICEKKISDWNFSLMINMIMMMKMMWRVICWNLLVWCFVQRHLFWKFIEQKIYREVCLREECLSDERYSPVLVDSTFLHGVKKMFNAAEDIKELIDPYVKLSFAGQEVFFMRIFLEIFLYLNRFHRKLSILVRIRNSIKNFILVSK